ncbi:hypothetical protein [Tunturiibacter gelidoferens]|uniref:Uncharacterized protein n=2 Tax=Tunturiibacter TaxID=3154218 RepID=A0A7Y9NPB3_9BACT|nr:hypothetical protein [Edaphobacter lichenicola]NYF52475.1 hypothetical protein [Edaphobacter lichenicola]
MDKRVCFLSLLSAVLICNCSPTYAQQSSFVERLPNGGVRFVVVVADGSGRPVTDLQQQDFTVFDDNLIRPIRAFVMVTGRKRTNEGYGVIREAALRSGGRDELLKLFPRYEITFDEPIDLRAKEYREVGIKVDRPGLKIITGQGYYVGLH